MPLLIVLVSLDNGLEARLVANKAFGMRLYAVRTGALDGCEPETTSRVAPIKPACLLRGERMPQRLGH